MFNDRRPRSTDAPFYPFKQYKIEFRYAFINDPTPRTGEFFEISRYINKALHSAFERLIAESELNGWKYFDVTSIVCQGEAKATYHEQKEASEWKTSDLT